MLTSEEVQSFKQEGHLVLPGFVEGETVAQWQEQFWGHLGCTIDEPDQWPERVDGFQPDPLFGNLPELQSIANQLGGGAFPPQLFRACCPGPD